MDKDTIIGGIVCLTATGIIICILLVLVWVGAVIQERNREVREMNTCGQICINDLQSCHATCSTKSDYKWWGGISNERTVCNVHCKTEAKNCSLICGFSPEQIEPVK